MKTVELIGQGNLYKCIFDDDIDTKDLYVSQKGYVIYATGEYADKYFSRILLSAPAHLDVDHKNRDPLDNRRKNLRLATRIQNQANRLVNKNKVSKLPKGVYKNGNNSYIARLQYKGIQYNLGTFMYPEHAKAAYEKKAEQLQGEFALHLNLPNL